MSEPFRANYIPNIMPTKVHSTSYFLVVKDTVKVVVFDVDKGGLLVDQDGGH